MGDYHGMDEPVVSLNNYPFETMDMEETYKLRSEKCLISLAKTCNLKRFCYNPDSKKDLVPIIVGKNKIEGGKCPGLKENIYSFNVTDGNQYDECKRYECSYCEEGASKVREYVSFLATLNKPLLPSSDGPTIMIHLISYFDIFFDFILGTCRCLFYLP